MHSIISAIPNLLSSLRLALACYFPFAPEHTWLLIILCGGASDFLDGWIARRWNLTSWQGGILDAVADKLFVLSVLLTFAVAGKFSGWLIFLIIARDLTVALIAGYAASCREWASFKKMDARMSGKIATTGQFVLMIAVCLVPQYTSQVLLVTILISLIAATDYAILFIKALKNKNKEGTK